MSLPAQIDVTLLMDRAPQVDAPALCACLDAVFAPSGLAFARQESQDGLAIAAQGVRLLLSGAEGPADPGRLRAALCSELGTILHEDWHGRVARHSGHVTLRVTAGAPLVRGETLMDGPDQDAFDRMLTVAHVAASHLAAREAPLAIHWGQCDQLFAPERFLKMADMLFPLPIFLHARPFSSGRTDGERLVVGCDLQGAAHIVGHPIRFEEAPVRMDWLMARGLALVAHLRGGGEPLRDGDSFGLAEGERFEAATGEDGTLALTLRERAGRPVLDPLPAAA